MLKFKGVFALLLLSTLLLFFCDESEAKGGRGGGGRGGGSRGGSRGGWGSSRGSSRSSSSKNKGSGSYGWNVGGSTSGKSYGSSGKTWTGTVVGGRNVLGNYKTFGTPNRWQMHGGRSFYYVGYPHYGYGGYGYGHGNYYGSRGYRYNDDDDYDEGNSLWNPWVVMIIVLIGINVLGLSIWGITVCYLKSL